MIIKPVSADPVSQMPGSLLGEFGVVGGIEQRIRGVQRCPNRATDQGLAGKVAALGQIEDRLENRMQGTTRNQSRQMPDSVVGDHRKQLPAP